ncbi:probable E3 ubiquitin-protein ligase RHG1A isoform X2 [Lactuca sativa]|uniref:probable E3 ubiquitin-protein ligase RHG1A isoform X2 n=1 Tax=Lactuca sativa TaxID=4236 RepID=UPI000CAAB6B5|nr:probable E3 ubiquitin-protein ligase RHG1A isoform X2 [Lactuca sativa]
MRHRHLSNSFTRFGGDQQDNNHTHTPVEHSYFPTGRSENGPFVGQNLMNHMSRGHRNLEGGSSRANEYPPPPPPSSNISMEVQPPFVPPFPHPSITGGHPAHYTNYNHLPNAHDMESGLLNHHHHHPTPNGVGGGPLKRKRSGSLNSLYTVGSSSSSSASQMPLEKPTLDPYRGNLTIDGQDSSRNVRRRYRHDDMESESSRSHVPNHFYQSAPVPHPPPPPPPPNYSSAAPHVPHYPAPSHIRDMRHEMNQFHVGGSSGDPAFSSSSRQNLHVHANNHSRRIHSSYGSASRYSHYGHGGTSSSTSGNGLRTPPDNFSPRNSRHWSPNGWRGNYSHRSGRPRIAVERFHSVVDVTESHDRIGHETLMMVDRGGSLYGNSRNFSDQYRDLRLDIDNMSYEELLNLEERIGSVNTGLSEDSMSKCLREKVYYSSSDQNQNQNQNHEEVSCPICLEEYKNGDAIGMMERCGHGYHVDCIKKWLLMKKLCPICKTECSNQ